MVIGVLDNTDIACHVNPGDTSIKLLQAVTWPIGSKIVIATTDFESPQSSHSEVARSTIHPRVRVAVS